MLPGYFYRASDQPGPTVIMFNGFDGSVEEMHFFGAVAAVERGYHVLCFDGPGQPGTRHRHGLGFRPDWEHVVTPVVKLIAEAYTNKQIGQILNVSEKTVESHRANVLAKLGMRDRVELVRYAIRRGLVEP